MGLNRWLERFQRPDLERLVHAEKGLVAAAQLLFLARGLLHRRAHLRLLEALQVIE